MSNFNCRECGTPILEGEDGKYITGCIHYPVNEYHKESLRYRKLRTMDAEEIMAIFATSMDGYDFDELVDSWPELPEKGGE